MAEGAARFLPAERAYLTWQQRKAQKEREEIGPSLPALLLGKSEQRIRRDTLSGDPTTNPEYMAAKRARILKEAGYGEDFVGPVQEEVFTSAQAMPQTPAAIPPEVAEYARQRMGSIGAMPQPAPGTEYRPPTKEQFELEAEDATERERETALERSRNIRGLAEGLETMGRYIGGIGGGYTIDEPLGTTRGLDEEIARKEDYVPLATRRMLESKGIKVPEGARLSDLERILPSVTRLTEQQVDEQARGREAQMKAIASMQPQPKKPLSEGKAIEVASIDDTIRRIDEVIADKPQFNTGPWVSRLESVLDFLGAGDWNPQGPEKKAFNAKLNFLLQTFVSTMERGNPSNKDRDFLRTVTPSPSDDDEELLRKAGQLREWMSGKKDRIVNALDQAGRETTGLSTIEFYDPDTGQTLDVPDDEIDRFMESRPNAVRQG